MLVRGDEHLLIALGQHDRRPGRDLLWRWQPTDVVPCADEPECCAMSSAHVQELRSRFEGGAKNRRGRKNAKYLAPASFTVQLDC